jgi:hypothetical protein
MTTSQEYVDTVSRYVKRQAVLYQLSDKDRNRCRLVMANFTVTFHLVRDGQHISELYLTVSPRTHRLLKVFREAKLSVLCQQVDEYLSTLSKALEPQSNDTDQD